MPNRIIREGFLDSEKVNALDVESECFYHRLLLACDDAGRADGRLSMLASRLYPVVAVKEDAITRRLRACSSQGLLLAYSCGCKPYLQVAMWQRCGNAATSRFPWRNGSHAIDYIKRDTRDGPKDFVKTSIPSVWGRDGVEVESNTETETNTGTESGAVNPVRISEQDAVGQVEGISIPRDFAAFVYADWSTRGGKDAAGNFVAWVPYVTKRWSRERGDWKAGKHKGRQASSEPLTGDEMLRRAVT